MAPKYVAVELIDCEDNGPCGGGDRLSLARRTCGLIGLQHHRTVRTRDLLKSTHVHRKVLMWCNIRSFEHQVCSVHEIHGL